MFSESWQIFIDDAANKISLSQQWKHLKNENRQEHVKHINLDICVVVVVVVYQPGHC